MVFLFPYCLGLMIYMPISQTISKLFITGILSVVTNNVSMTCVGVKSISSFSKVVSKLLIVSSTTTSDGSLINY